MAEWQDGRMAGWQDGRMAKWREGGKAGAGRTQSFAAAYVISLMALMALTDGDGRDDDDDGKGVKEGLLGV